MRVPRLSNGQILNAANQRDQTLRQLDRGSDARDLILN